MFSFTQDMLHFSKLQQQHVRQQWKILETAANENKTEQHNEHYSGSFGSSFRRMSLFVSILSCVVKS